MNSDNSSLLSRTNHFPYKLKIRSKKPSHTHDVINLLCNIKIQTERLVFRTTQDSIRIFRDFCDTVMFSLNGSDFDTEYEAEGGELIRPNKRGPIIWTGSRNPSSPHKCLKMFGGKLYIICPPNMYRCWRNRNNAGCIVTTLVTSMKMLFVGCAAFNEDISHFDTSSVVDMSMMFSDAKSFNQPVDFFDTSQVLDMSGMFNGALSFDQPIGYNGFNTSNVTNMSLMFSRALRFNQKFGPNFRTNSVNSMRGMFFSAASFDQSLGDNFDTTSVTDMSTMFCYAVIFNGHIGDKFDTSSVSNMRSMFQGAACFNQPLPERFTFSSVKDVSCMSKGASCYEHFVNLDTGYRIQYGDEFLGPRMPETYIDVTSMTVSERVKLQGSFTLYRIQDDLRPRIWLLISSKEHDPSDQDDHGCSELSESE